MTSINHRPYDSRTHDFFGGGHGFGSCRGLRFFLCPHFESCSLDQFTFHILPSQRLKFTIFTHFVSTFLDGSRETKCKTWKRNQTKTHLIQFQLFIFFKPACWQKNLQGGLLSIRVFSSDGLYLNNNVFLSRNYRLIVAPRKFDVLKTNMLVFPDIFLAHTSLGKSLIYPLRYQFYKLGMLIRYSLLKLTGKIAKRHVEQWHAQSWVFFEFLIQEKQILFFLLRWLDRLKNDEIHQKYDVLKKHNI